MGLIQAVKNVVNMGLGEQWKEALEADDMGQQTVFTKGVMVRTDGENSKGTPDIVTNGSVIHVYPNQFMMLVDGGKVVDYTAEPGYYTIDGSSAPSLLNGQFGDTLKDAFKRIAFGGTNPQKQEVFFINLQEIKGIKFGTPNPVNYWDSEYKCELFIRSFGEYSVKVTNPLLFFEQVIPRNAKRVEFSDISSQYQSEFIMAYQAALNQLSADGVRIGNVVSKGLELAQKMRVCLDDDWNQSRGFEIDHVGVNSISFTEESMALLKKISEAELYSDPSRRQAYVQTTIAEGIKAAGENPNGAAQAFMGLGMAMNSGGAFMGSASDANFQEIRMKQQAEMAKQQSAQNTGSPVSAGSWTCECGAVNAGNFCSNCGKAKPAAPEVPAGQWFCPNCGAPCNGNFCTKCGTARPQA